jgi:acyl carrier protein
MSELFQYYNTGHSGQVSVYATLWKAQSFTVQISHKISSIKAYLFRLGSPGTITVSIRAVDGEGKPTGGDLCSGTFNGNIVDTSPEWIEFTFSTNPILISGTKYAIVMRVPSGAPGSDWIYWGDDTTGEYSGGEHLYSIDSGSSWTALSDIDLLFEDWGLGFTDLSGSINSSSFLNGGLDVLTELIGIINETSSLLASLYIDSAGVVELVGEINSSSFLNGGLDVLTELIGIINETSSLLASLYIDSAGVVELVGEINSSSFLNGGLDVLTELIGIINETSSLLANLNSPNLYIGLYGLINEVSSINGNLDVITQLIGSVLANSSVIAVLFAPNLDIGLYGNIDAVSNLFGVLTVPEIGIYRRITNDITSYFNDIAVSNNIIVRYDNDPRDTPTDELWCKVSVTFGNAQQKEIGINSYRIPGNFEAQIKNSIKLGMYNLLYVADIIDLAFKSIDVGNIIFRVPRVVNVGKIDDNFQVNVICPFYVDR